MAITPAVKTARVRASSGRGRIRDSRMPSGMLKPEAPIRKAVTAPMPTPWASRPAPSGSRTTMLA